VLKLGMSSTIASGISRMVSPSGTVKRATSIGAGSCSSTASTSQAAMFSFST
jgi:hypothetical protein